MASYTFDNSVPPNSETPRNGATRIRNLAIAILSMLNLPNNSGAQTVAGPFISSFDPSGNPTFPIGSAVAGDPALALGLVPKQYADAKVPYIIAAGGDAYTGTFADIPSLLNGQLVTVKFVNANTTTNPTFNLNSLGAAPLVTLTGGTISIGTIQFNAVFDLVYDSATAAWVLIGATNASSPFPLTADASAGGFKITNLANATISGDALNLGQLPAVNNALGSISFPTLVSGAEVTFILNWGLVTPTSVGHGATATTAVSFGTPYVSNCFAVVAGAVAGSGTDSILNCVVNVENTTVGTTGFSIQIGNNSGGTNHTYGAYWVAIGV